MFKKILLPIILFSIVTSCHQSGDEQASSTIHLMSFNVRHGTSLAYEPNLEAQAAIILAQNPDFVGLQEIDNMCERSFNIDQAKTFGKLTQMTATFGAFMPYDGGEYGMATLTRLKILNTENLELPGGAEPRIAIIQSVRLDNNVELALVNVHFDWTESSLRLPQAQTLIRRLNEMNLPTIVLGDYNAEPGSATIELFEKSGFTAIAKAGQRFTWEAEDPDMEIDHIYFREAGKVKISADYSYVLEEKTGSDHRPLVAEILVSMQ